MILGVTHQNTKFVIPVGKTKQRNNKMTQSFEKWLLKLNDNNNADFTFYSDKVISEPGLYIALAIFHKKPNFALWLHNKEKNRLDEHEIINCIVNTRNTQQFELIMPLLECPCILSNNKPLPTFKFLATIKELPPEFLIRYFIQNYQIPDVVRSQKNKALSIIFKLCVEKNNFEHADTIIRFFFESQKDEKK